MLHLATAVSCFCVCLFLVTILDARSNSPTRDVSGDALVKGTPRQQDAKGKHVRSATESSPRKRKSGQDDQKKRNKKKKPEYAVAHQQTGGFTHMCHPTLSTAFSDSSSFLCFCRGLNVSVSDDESTDSFSTDSSFGWLNSPYAHHGLLLQ